MSTPAETVRDLLLPGVAYMLRDRPDVEATLISTHGRIDIVAKGPGGSTRQELITCREVDDGAYAMLFKPRVEAAIQKVLA